MHTKTLKIGVGDPTKTATKLYQRYEQGFIYSLLIKESPLNAQPHIKPGLIRPKSKPLDLMSYMDATLPYLRVGQTILRTKSSHRGGND